MLSPSDDETCLSATDSAFGVEEVIRIGSYIIIYGSSYHLTLKFHILSDFIATLPYELAVQIMTRAVDMDMVVVLNLVSKQWATVLKDNDLWRTFYMRRWGPLSHPKKLISLQSRNRDWKDLFARRLKLHNNWIDGKVTARFINGHVDSVYCIQFDGQNIVSGSRDRTIKFWDIESQKCLKTLRGHDGSVLCLQYDSRYIVTGSSDSTIIVWDIHTGEKVHTLRGHTSPVLDVRFNDRIIVSCSKDCTIKIWDVQQGVLIRTLEGHHAAVNAVHLHNNLIASASGDCIIKLWDANTGQCLRDFSGHSRGLACVQFDGETIVSGSNDRTIRVWNAHTGETIRVLDGHHDLVRTLCFDKERIVSGSYDQTIKVWDFRTGELLLDLKDAHTSWVFHVQIDASKIISASQVSIVGWGWERFHALSFSGFAD